MSAHERYHRRWTICLGRTENTKGSRALRRRRHSHAIVVVVVVSCCDCRPRSDHLCLDQIDVRLRLLHSMVVVLACIIVVVVVVIRVGNETWANVVKRNMTCPVIDKVRSGPDDRSGKGTNRQGAFTSERGFSLLTAINCPMRRYGHSFNQI